MSLLCVIYIFRVTNQKHDIESRDHCSLLACKQLENVRKMPYVIVEGDLEGKEESNRFITSVSGLKGIDPYLEECTFKS